MTIGVFAIGYIVFILVLVVCVNCTRWKFDSYRVDSPMEDVVMVETGEEYVDKNGYLQKKKIELAKMVGIPECQVMYNRYQIDPTELDLAAYSIARNGFQVDRKLPSEHVSFESLRLPTMERRMPFKYMEKMRSGQYIVSPYRDPIGIVTNEVVM